MAVLVSKLALPINVAEIERVPTEAAEYVALHAPDEMMQLPN